MVLKWLNVWSGVLHEGHLIHLSSFFVISQIMLEIFFCCLAFNKIPDKNKVLAQRLMSDSTSHLGRLNAFRLNSSNLLVNKIASGSN